MNVVGLKLSVFMMSAAIVDLGGCLFAEEIGAVTADRLQPLRIDDHVDAARRRGCGLRIGRPSVGPCTARFFIALQGGISKLGDEFTVFTVGACGSCVSPPCSPP